MVVDVSPKSVICANTGDLSLTTELIQQDSCLAVPSQRNTLPRTYDPVILRFLGLFPARRRTCSCFCAFTAFPRPQSYLVVFSRSSHAHRRPCTALDRLEGWPGHADVPLPLPLAKKTGHRRLEMSERSSCALSFVRRAEAFRASPGHAMQLSLASHRVSSSALQSRLRRQSSRQSSEAALGFQSDRRSCVPVCHAATLRYASSAFLCNASLWA